MSALLSFENITKRFVNNGTERIVFDGLNLAIGEGELVTILGKSGCGKTTLLRCAGGFSPPDQGRVLLDGAEVTTPTPAISMVFQTFDQLFPWKTVLGNLTFPLSAANRKLTKPALEAAARHYLDMVNLTDFASYYPYQLSGGMKQRVAIARSLSLNSRVILMDEPFAALDAQTRTLLQVELLRLWKKTGVTVLFITHNIEEAIILGSRLILLGSRSGRVILDMPNPVSCGGEMRTPKDAGFSSCWELLKNTLNEEPEKCP